MPSRTSGHAVRGALLERAATLYRNKVRPRWLTESVFRAKYADEPNQAYLASLGTAQFLLRKGRLRRRNCELRRRNGEPTPPCERHHAGVQCFGTPIGND